MQQIKNLDGAAVCFLAVLTNAFCSAFGKAAQNAPWISHIIAGAAFVLCADAFARVCDIHRGKSFFELTEAIIKKPATKALGAALVLLMLLTASVSLTSFSHFVKLTSLPRTPQITLPVLIALTAGFSLRSVRAAVSSARLIVWFAAFVGILFLLLGANEISPKALFPINGGVSGILLGAVEVFLNRFAFLPALLSVYTRMSKEKTRRRDFLVSLSLGATLVASISFVTAGTLGERLYAADFYPVYTAMTVFGVGGFIRHTEIFACMAMTLSLFFKTAVCLMFAEDYVFYLFPKSKGKSIAVSAALFISALSRLIWSDAGAFRSMVELHAGGTALFISELLLPFVLLIIAKKGQKESLKR